jgi:diacylglycerol kinase
MHPMTYAKLVSAIEKVLDDQAECDHRTDDGYIYDTLAKDMASGAELVYDASMRAQEFAEAQ